MFGIWGLGFRVCLGQARTSKDAVWRFQRLGGFRGNGLNRRCLLDVSFRGNAWLGRLLGYLSIFLIRFRRITFGNTFQRVLKGIPVRVLTVLHMVVPFFFKCRALCIG